MSMKRMMAVVEMIILKSLRYAIRVILPDLIGPSIAEC
jgi:hypothetical protein